MKMKASHLLVLSVLLFSLVSCEILGVDPSKQAVSDVDVNNWIYDQMKEYYLWEDKIKALPETDLSLNPSDYFYSLLYDYKVTDRFSWIQESSEELKNSLNGVTTTFGLNFSPFFADNEKTKIAFAINYVLEGSAAERMGLKRGDIITKVNGEDITIYNYSILLLDDKATFTFGEYTSAGTIESTEKSVEVTKEVTAAKAINFHKIIELNRKKIGYFVYTQFLTSSDKELNNLFGDFKKAGIDELVVDLRYNPGGYVSSAELMSSLIVKNLNKKNLMTRQVWNAQKTKEFTEKGGPDVFNTYFFENKEGIGLINNLNSLDRVYFLVSNGTASSSEMVINNLKPYMDVILVGQHTYGKNVGSITIEDETKPQRWKWGMQPIVLKSVNANDESDYGTKEGFKPDIEVNDNILPFRDFGDPEETLLYAALLDIVSEPTLAKANIRARPSSTSVFTPVTGKSLSDNPYRNRYEMWITEFPHQK